MIEVMTIRSYREADEAQVAALWSDIFPEQRPWNQPPAYIARKLGFQRELFLVGEIDGRVVATVVGGFDGVRGWIYHLAVVPARRRCGYGHAMMEAVERELAALGCPKINLQILPQNTEVAHFYERLGYAVEERVSMGKLL